MKPKHQRLVFVLLSIAVMSGAAFTILTAFRDNLVFFFTPTQLLEKQAQEGFDPAREMRLGGLVKNGSVEQMEHGIAFVVTDLTHERGVIYRGLLPTLFREGQGVVATGTLDGERFIAREILAKHDENYMPKEVADAIKQSGQWKQDE